MVRSCLVRDDDHATAGKPPCDWDDRAAREALVDALVRDALAALDALDGHEIPASATSATELLALVAGQDVDQGDDGVFRIARKVAKDRVISTVDVEARHGPKPEVLGDSAYADGATSDDLEGKGFTVTAKCPPVRNATGGFTKDRFDVDLQAEP